ncbi:MAG: response regulator [Bernardetiaceae bacterium]
MSSERKGKHSILYVDDEKYNLTAFKAAFRREYKVFVAETAEEGIELLAQNPIELVITDQRMPEVTGVEFLKRIVPDYPHVIRMILTGFSDVQDIISAINEGGVYRYITKPWDKDDLRITIDRALESYELSQENRRLIHDLQEANRTLEQKVIKRTQEITAQKEIIEQKNLNILDSINYAQRIQQASLPTQARMADKLKDFFVLYMPRDIVSGDFYWFESQIDPASGHEKLLLAAIDCTGHGVPGAFVSLIGKNLLDQIVILGKTFSPDQILNRLHAEINRALNQQHSQNRDGMDMTLCVIDLADQTMEVSGAKNPMLRIQEGSSEAETFKTDRFSVGGFTDKQQPFTKQSFSLQTPACYYIFSDGYQDQFGGPEGRKFMKKRMREFIFDIHTLPMPEQKERLHQEIKDWMGDKEAQIDDILVIGFKI